MTYAGVCYDGPLEGEGVQTQHSYFMLALYNGAPRLKENYILDYPPEYRQGRYRWSYPLRKWVFES